MTIAELAIILKIKAEGAEKLKAMDDGLKATAKSAKAAADAIKQTNDAIEDTRQQKFAFDSAAGDNLTFFFDKDNLQGLPPVLDKVADKQKKASFASKVLAIDLSKVESWANRTALKLDVLAAGLLFVVDTAMRGAAALEQFSLSTGLSVAGLQAEQGAGVRGGITPQDMASFVTSLQAAGARMQISGEGVGPWSLLARLLGLKGVNFQDPIALVNQLHVGLMKLRPDQLAIARTLAEQAGIPANVFAGLRNPEFNPTGFQQIYDITARNLGNMNKLNAEWASLKFNVVAAKNAFVSEFSPAIESGVRFVSGILDVFSRFVEWLDRGSLAATAVKVVIGLLAFELGVAALAVSALAVGLGALIPLIAAVDLGLLPILGTILAIAAAAGLIVGALVAANALKPDHSTDVVGLSDSVRRRGFQVAPGTLDTEFFRDPRGSSSGGTTVNQTNSFNVNEAQKGAATARDMTNHLTLSYILTGLNAQAPSR